MRKFFAIFLSLICLPAVAQVKFSQLPDGGNFNPSTDLVITVRDSGGNDTDVLTLLGALSILDAAPAGTLTGSSLAAGVTGSSLTGVGIITSGTWTASVIGSNYGGAGAISGALKANGSGIVSQAATGDLSDISSFSLSTSGTATAASLSPSSAASPVNGIYLPAAGVLGFSANTGEKMALISTSGLIVGSASTVTAGSPSGQGTISVVGLSGNDGYRSMNWGSSQSAFSFINSAGASIGTHGALSSNALIGDIDFYGDDGTSYTRGVSIRTSTDGSPSSGALPSKYNIFTYNPTTGLTEAWRVDAAHHISSLGRTPTSITSCGTGSPGVSGTDAKGVITTGTGGPTACTLNFADSYASNPVCVANASAGSITVTAVSTSAVTFTISAGLTSGSIYYMCLQ